MNLTGAPSYDDSCVLRLHEQARQVPDQVNLAVLTAVAALEMNVATGAADDGDGRGQDLQLLDNKLNVLIQMFAGFWRQQCDLPEPVAVTLGAEGLRFDAGSVEVPAAVASVELFLSAALPQALVLPVASCEHAADGLWELRFAALSDDLDNALARHVFRRHRRAVAQTRQASNLHCAGE